MKRRRSQEPRALSRVRKAPTGCPRCGGLLSPERFSDFCDQAGQYHFRGWRCLSCGEVIDPVILANRRLPGRFTAVDKK